MGNVYLGDKKVTSKGWYLGDAPLFDESLFPITIDGVTYEEDDAHIFVANGNEVNLPIPDGTTPKFVAVDEVAMDYDTQVKGNVFDGHGETPRCGEPANLAVAQSFARKPRDDLLFQRCNHRAKRSRGQLLSPKLE